MRSMRPYIDGHSIAADVRMQRQSHKGSFALLEGATDLKRFGRFFSQAICCIITFFGKPNVTTAINLLESSGFKGAVGIVDHDFDVILNVGIQHRSIICSEYHDFDLDMMSSSALSIYLNEVVDERKMPGNWNAKSVIESIMLTISLLSLLKLAYKKYALGYKLSELRLSEFFDGNSIDRSKLLDAVSMGQQGQTVRYCTRLLSYSDQFSIDSLDLYHLTSGHDLCEALGISLRSKFGAKRDP